jgi:hypothetical protein
MSNHQPAIVPSSRVSDSPSENGSLKATKKADNDGYPDDAVPHTAPALASQQGQRMEAALGDSILRFLRIRKPRKDNIYDLDAVRFNETVAQGKNTDMRPDRHAAQYLGLARHRRIQGTLHTSTVGELVSIRSRISMDMAGRKRRAPQG